MTILNTIDLIPRFETRLREADEVDIAVAWMWSGPHLKALQDVVRDKAARERSFAVRAIIGLDRNGTHPAALSTLTEFAEVRVPHRELYPRGIFHPKVFLFRSAGRSIAWIGSANFTSGGFLQNVEAVWELDGAEDAEAWFSQLWSRLSANAGDIIARYVADWSPPTRSPEAGTDAPEAETLPTFGGGRKLELNLVRNAGWSDYLAGLIDANLYWRQWAARHLSGKSLSVTDRGWSWRDTIEKGGMIVRRPDWTGLSDHERHILLGISERDGAYGLLGSMRGAGVVKRLFKGGSVADRRVLRRLRATLGRVFDPSPTAKVIGAARDALEEMTSEPGVGPGVVTRLLSLARPDVCVSVNNGSAPELGRLTGLPGTAGSLGKPDNYKRLLEWIAARPWHRSERPSDPWEAHLWSMRAALVDCCVYEPV